MNEAETREWRKMLRNVGKEQIQDNTTIDDDGVKHIDVQFTLIHDDRRANWQRILLDAIDEDAVLCSVGRFLYQRMEEKTRRHEAGERWTDDRGKTFVFGHYKSDELRAAADRAIVFSMSKVVSKIIKRIEKKYKLTETQWYDHIDRDQMHSVVYEILLVEYVAVHPDL